MRHEVLITPAMEGRPPRYCDTAWMLWVQFRAKIGIIRSSPLSYAIQPACDAFPQFIARRIP